MSIVAVHSYQMYGPGTGITTPDPTGNIVVTPNEADGRAFTFSIKGTGHAPADLSWTFTGGVPATATGYGPTSVSFAAAGTHLVQCVVVAGAGGTPAPATYSVTVTSTGTAGPRMAEAEAGTQAAEDAGMGGTDVQVEPDMETPAQAPEYDPGDYTVHEVTAYATEHPEEAGAIYAAELEGKGRSTLLDHLATLIPYDPGDYTVAEVTQYAEEHPDEVADILAAEQAGKNRTTLVSHLEALIG